MNGGVYLVTTGLFFRNTMQNDLRSVRTRVSALEGHVQILRGIDKAQESWELWCHVLSSCGVCGGALGPCLFTLLLCYTTTETYR